MKTMKSLVMALVGAYALLLWCSGAWAWQRSIEFAWANAVAVDAAGNVVAAGSIETATGGGFIVVKYSGATGAELWRRVISGTANGNWASAIAVDAAGNVVAAGTTENIGTGSDFTVVKFDGVSGTELWRRVISGTNNDFHEAAHAVVLDAVGNVVAAGLTNNTGTSDFTVVKIDGATGLELWRKEINGINNGHDYVNALALDNTGNVVAAGATSDVVDGVGDENFTVIKFDGVSGAELWRKVVVHATFDGSGWANAVAVDAAGNVVAAGHSHIHNGTNSSDFTVIKFDGASGAELWRKMIHAGANDLAHAVTLDVAGNVVAAGFTENPNTGIDFTVIKFDGTSGAELWRQLVDGAFPNSHDFANAVTVDAAGNVVAAGTTVNGSYDFTVIKFDGANGAELWRQVINVDVSSSGSGASFDVANAVVVDAAGNVVAAGTTGGVDFTVIKMAGTGTVLSATPTSVTAGANVTVMWNGIVSPMAGDWIGLYIPGTPDSALVANSWIYPNCSQVKGSGGIEAGSCLFHLPASLALGTYELRLFANNSLLRLAKSAPFTVQAAPPATLTATPSIVGAGTSVTATWSGIASPMSGDWIGLYVPGAADSVLVSSVWIYVSCSQVKGSSGVASGLCLFQIPSSLAAGTYELRIFANNSLVRLATSGTFTVEAAPPAILSASPSSVSAGANVTATWSGIVSATPGDWIGLYVPGFSDSALMASAWIYVSCSQAKGSSGVASGSCPFQIPASLAAGTYELRLFANNSLVRLGRSSAIAVN